MNPERYPYNVSAPVDDLPRSGPLSLDMSLVEVILMDDVDTRDYPDFADAYIAEALYDGKPASDDVLYLLNEDTSFINEQAHKWVTR